MHEAMVRRLAVHHLSQHQLLLQWSSFVRWEDLPVDVPVDLPSANLTLIPRQLANRLNALVFDARHDRNTLRTSNESA